MFRSIFSLLLTVFVFQSVLTVAQTKKPKQTARSMPTISMGHEANPAFPFGRLNPKAPPETKQFDFIVGEFDCTDKILNPQTGKWFTMKAFRRAAYVLDGYAIQDQNWTPIFNSTNLRVYDPKAKQWEVSYFRTPVYVKGTWKGGKEGENMVVRKGTAENGSRLSFYNISKNAYSWKAETIKDGKAKLTWDFTCKRRR